MGHRKRKEPWNTAPWDEPAIDVRECFPTWRPPIGTITLIQHDWVNGWAAQLFTRYRDGWDAIGPVQRITMSQFPRGEPITFVRPNVPITSLPSTRERILRASLDNAIGRANQPPQREEVLI
jgi:hypothetical protein